MNCFGIKLDKEFDSKAAKNINLWRDALAIKDYARADEIRKELEDSKII
jgi:cysteinyl-tRNA synthetase